MQLNQDFPCNTTMYHIIKGHFYGKIGDKVTIVQPLLIRKEVGCQIFSDLTKAVKNCRTELNA
jgi:hypothetical protein